MKRPVLIVDDVENIVIRLSEFLKKLGYEKIHSATDPEKAVEQFEELGKNEHPLVFLDSDLDQLGGISLLSRLLKSDADGEIIILTSHGRESELIRKLIDEGAYEVIQKPLHFESIKNIMKVVEAEYSPETISDPTELVLNLMKTTNRVSELWLKENSNLADDSLKQILNELVSSNKISQIDNIQDSCCNSCSSVRTGHIFHCPECKKSNFKQTDLIEHYDCGTIETEDNFQDDKCPVCNKQLEALGVDYRKMKNFFVCLECNERFSEPACDYICLKCNNRFSEDEVSWKSSKGYQLR
ncbi:MAG: response regulator [Nitrosopumilaceae archaeon]|nr:response regulator [Nitrosopumilaceae archaeon]